MAFFLFRSSNWRQIPYRLRYAICIGAILGFIISLGLLQLQPQQNLPVNTINNNDIPNSNSPASLNLTLPIMYYGQILQVNLSFNVLATLNYSLSIGLYEITNQNSSSINNIEPIGNLDTWNATNSSILGKIFVITYYIPHNDYYLFMIKTSNGNSSVNWNLRLNILGTNAVHNTMIWLLYFIGSIALIILLFSLIHDFYTIVKHSDQIKQNQINSRHDTTNKEDINNVIINFSDNIGDINEGVSTGAFFNIYQSFKIIFLPIIKKPNIFMLLTAYMFISFISGYLLTTFLIINPVYKPVHDATINILLSAPIIRFSFIFLILLQVFISQELWNDKESGFLETILSFPISSKYYFITKLLIQQIFSILLIIAFFIPIMTFYFSIPSLNFLNFVELLYFLLTLYFLIWIITGIFFVLNNFFITDTAVLIGMFTFFGWIVLSIGLSSNPTMLIFAPSGLNPISIDSIEFLTEYFFRANGFHIHSTFPSFALIVEAIIIQSFLALIPIILSIFITKRFDPVKK